MKAAKLPPRERQCETCGHKFKSHKVACKCHSKVVYIPEVLAVSEVSCPLSPDDAEMSEVDVPLASLTLRPAPTAPTHSTSMPPVTIGLGVKSGPSTWLYPAFKHLVDSTVMVISASKKASLMENKEFEFLGRVSLVEADNYARSFHSGIVNLLDS